VNIPSVTTNRARDHHRRDDAGGDRPPVRPDQRRRRHVREPGDRGGGQVEVAGDQGHDHRERDQAGDRLVGEDRPDVRAGPEDVSDTAVDAEVDDHHRQQDQEATSFGDAQQGLRVRSAPRREGFDRRVRHAFIRSRD
jgi:hypothetical protein